MHEQEKQIAAVLRIIEERDEARKNIATIAETRDNAVKRLEIVRALLNSPYGDETTLNVHEAAERVVKERNALWLEVTHLKCPAPVPPGWGTEDILNIGKILNRAYDETPMQAAERVVRERDETKADAIKRMQDVREVLSRQPDGSRVVNEINTREAAERVLTERDEAQKRAETFRKQLESHERMSANLRSILGHPQVTIEEAARLVVDATAHRVVKSRDEAVRQCEVLASYSDFRMHEYLVVEAVLQGAVAMRMRVELDDANELVPRAEQHAKERDRKPTADTNREPPDLLELLKPIHDPKMSPLDMAKFYVAQYWEKDKTTSQIREALGAGRFEPTEAAAMRVHTVLVAAQAEVEKLRALPRDMARALNLCSGDAKPEEMLAACRKYREEYGKALEELKDLRQHNEHLLASVAHEQNLASKVLKELEDANLARDRLQKHNAELSKSLEVAVRDRDLFFSKYMEKATGEKPPGAPVTPQPSDAPFPSNDPNNPRLGLEGFRVGDLVRKPTSEKHFPIERVGPGHAGYWYVYLDGGGWGPEALVRKPVEVGDTVRHVGTQPKPAGPWRVKDIQDHSATITCGDALMVSLLSGLVAVVS